MTILYVPVYISCIGSVRDGKSAHELAQSPDHLLLGSMHTNIDWWELGHRTFARYQCVHKHELKRGSSALGHPVYCTTSAALLTALQTPCCMHAGVCAGWRTKFSCYLPPVSLPLSLDRGARRKVQRAAAHQAISPQAPSSITRLCTLH